MQLKRVLLTGVKTTEKTPEWLLIPTLISLVTIQVVFLVVNFAASEALKLLDSFF